MPEWYNYTPKRSCLIYCISIMLINGNYYMLYIENIPVWKVQSDEIRHFGMLPVSTMRGVWKELKN